MLFGQVRAVVNGVEKYALARQSFDDDAVNTGKVRAGEETSPDARLIRYDHQATAKTRQLAQTLHGVGYERYLFGPGQVMALLDDRSVAVE